MAQTLEEQAKDPSTPSLAYRYMAPKWDMIRHLLGGTAAMRQAGAKYLPQHPKEPHDNYKRRLEVTTLTNYTEQTLNSLVGKPFSDPVALKDDVPESVAALMEDVDLQGNDITSFCRNWFSESIACAFAHVLVDFPELPEPINGVTRTAEDDVVQGLRPYWVYIRPENLLSAFYEMENGREVLTQIRFAISVLKPIGFAEVYVEQIKVIERYSWTLYEKREDEKSKKVSWVVIKAGINPLGVIPLVTFYADKKGFMMGKPPMEDLAYLNVRHWQSTSDQINVLTVARFPMLAVSGTYAGPGDGKDSISIGPRALLSTQAENGKFYYVEHTGKAIGEGTKDLDKLEQDMAAYGAEFLRKRPGGTTATARALDSAEATSPLLDMTNRFMDAVNTVLYFTNLYFDPKAETGGTVSITTDFGPDEVNETDLRSLNEARRNRDISRKAYHEEMKRRGVLNEDFDSEADVKELKDEVQIVSPFATGTNVDGSAGGNMDNTGKEK